MPIEPEYKKEFDRFEILVSQFAVRLVQRRVVCRKAAVKGDLRRRVNRQPGQSALASSCARQNGGGCVGRIGVQERALKLDPIAA